MTLVFISYFPNYCDIIRVLCAAIWYTVRNTPEKTGASNDDQKTGVFQHITIKHTQGGRKCASIPHVQYLGFSQ